MSKLLKKKRNEQKRLIFIKGPQLRNAGGSGLVFLKK